MKPYRPDQHPTLTDLPARLDTKLILRGLLDGCRMALGNLEASLRGEKLPMNDYRLRQLLRAVIADAEEGHRESDT